MLAHWDEGPQKLTVWTSTQVPHLVKQQVAQCLGLSEMRIRVIAPEVGGGFGCKIPVYAEECLLPWISRQLRRPVKWAETRTENLMNTTHGRGHVHEIEVRLHEGRASSLALRGRVISDVRRVPVVLRRRDRDLHAADDARLLHAEGGSSVEVVCRLHEHDGDRRLPRRGPARGGLHRRARDGRDRGRDRARPASRCGGGTSSRRAPSRSPPRPARSTTRATTRRTLDKALARFDYAGARARARRRRAPRASSSASASRPSPRSAGSGRRTGASPIQRTRQLGERPRCASSRPAT